MPAPTYTASHIHELYRRTYARGAFRWARRGAQARTMRAEIVAARAIRRSIAITRRSTP